MIAGLVLALLSSSAAPLGAPGSTAWQADPPRPREGSTAARADVETACARAAAENRRVLILWSATWSGACTAFDRRCWSDSDARNERSDEYVEVRVDVGSRDLDGNADMAASYGAVFETSDLPYLTVLDAQGKVLANRSSSTFRDATSRAFDGRRVVEFLRPLRAPRAKADDLFAAALARAKSLDKHVFVSFGAPQPWSDTFGTWMWAAHVRPVLAKDFVVQHVDVERNLGGRELRARLGAKDASVPWYCVVDAEGKVLGSSLNAQGRNIGLPGPGEDLATFRALFAKVRKHMTQADVDWLAQELVPFWERTQRRGGAAH